MVIVDDDVDSPHNVDGDDKKPKERTHPWGEERQHGSRPVAKSPYAANAASQPAGWGRRGEDAQLLPAARLPDFDPDQRRRMVIVSLQVALALLPLTLGPDSSHGDAFATEFKAALRAYWAAPFHDSA